MAVLIQVRGVDKRYGDQVLLDNADVSLVDDVKVGFVGRNGAGKSTLLRILLGEEDVDRGEVIHHPSLRVGYLRQHTPFLPGESALDFLIRDSGQPDWKCGEIAGQFELKGPYLEGPVSALSGGWQTRVKLAALLLHDPNLLMLDEPTNFLDLRTQILLEHFLRQFNKAALIVSHDRAFLQATCTHTLELSRGKLTMFTGKIDAFLTYREERLDHDRRVNATVSAKQKQLQRFIDKNRARASTAAQAKSKAKQLERLQTTEIEVDEPVVRIQAPRVQPRSGTALRCTDLAIGYPDVTVAQGIGLEIEHGQRVAIVGDNGQGKTTLLRTLVGSLPATAGQMKWGHGCSIGTYAQHVYSSLDERQTVLETLEYNSDREITRQQVLAMAGALLFRDEHVNKKVKVLSGGERARLCMASLLLGTDNILVLDEPGNHLDVETFEALADALLEYQGTVIFTSHDRHFMSRVATCVIEVREGTVRNFHGDYATYLQSIQQEVDEGERQRSATSGAATADNGGKNGKPSKNGSKTESHSQSDKKTSYADYRAEQQEQRRAEKELKNLEKKINRLDEEKRQLQKQLLNETDAAQVTALQTQIGAIEVEMSAAEDRWLELNPS